MVGGFGVGAIWRQISQTLWTLWFPDKLQISPETHAESCTAVGQNEMQTNVNMK